MPVFKGTKQFYEFDASDILAHNLSSWLNYGLLEIGAFTNITRDNVASGYSYLQRAYDPRYTNGRVFECLGPSLVWESGVSVLGGLDSPVRISGVYINDNFYPTPGTGSGTHQIDYNNGRVIFASGIADTDNVTANYALRDVAVYLSDAPQWKTIINSYEDFFLSLENAQPSGLLASKLKENRVWLPCVVIDIQDRTNTGLQLGGGEYQEFAVFYHVFADRPAVAKRISDLLNNQEGKTLNLYDVNSVPYPLNFDGSLYSGAITYPDLSNRNGDYFWTYAYIENSQGGPKESITDLYRAEIIQKINIARYLSTY